MSKNRFKVIFIFLMGIIILSPSIYTTLALEISRVDIKEGEIYKWRLKLNISNFIRLTSDTGQGSIPGEMVALSLPGETEIIPMDIILEILHVPDELYFDSFFDVWTTLTEATLILAPDYNISTIPIFYPLNFTIQASRTPVNYSILKADTPNYFSILIGFLLIVATDLNWTNAASQLQTQIQMYYMRTSRVESRDLGLRITIPADTTTSTTELILNYNSKGILENAYGNYDGPQLFTIDYMGAGTTGSIAFEFPIFWGIFIIALVTLMIRRKKEFCS